MATVRTGVRALQTLIQNVVDMAFTISDGVNSQVVTDGDTITFVSATGVTVSVSGLNVTVQNDRTAAQGVRLDGNEYKLSDGSTPITENVALIGTSGVDLASIGFDNVLWRGENSTVIESPNLVDIEGNNEVEISSNVRIRAIAPVLQLDPSLTGTPVSVVVGTGSPETVVTANPGSLYLNKSGGAGTTLYVKESGTGNTGWIAK